MLYKVVSLSIGITFDIYIYFKISTQRSVYILKGYTISVHYPKCIKFWWLHFDWLSDWTVEYGETRLAVAFVVYINISVLNMLLFTRLALVTRDTHVSLLFGVLDSKFTRFYVYT